MNITEEIRKQISAGFSADEIRTNLRTNGFSETEIQQNMKAIKAAPVSSSSGGRSIGVTMLIFLAACIRGGLWISRGQTGIGIFIICLGVLALAAYAYGR